MNIGDRVTLHATIRSIIDGRASLIIPTFNFPFSIPAPPKAKKGATINLYGIVDRIYDDDVTVLLDLGGVITIKESAIVSVEPGEKQAMTARDAPT